MVKKRVAIAMSGGVDSSVSVYLLKKKGYECIGLTMCFGLDTGNADSKKPACCGQEGINEARKVSKFLRIKHYVLNLGNEFNKRVIDKFCSEYLSGRTPNPCIDCNSYIKFDTLLRKAKELDCDYLATGHYARIIYKKCAKKYLLKKGKDKHKDQSYFLYAIDKEALPFTLMPIGNMTKQAVRDLARKIKLPAAERPESQEICFVPDNNYHGLIKARSNKNITSGVIVDKQGSILGKHKGIPFYTIGQRDGLGIAYKERLYIIDIDVKNNKIIVGAKNDTYSSGLIAKEPKFLAFDKPKEKVVCEAKIRYNHPQAKCNVSLLANNRLKVEFKEPQMSITPGQAVVFYDRDVVIGGATIEKRI